MLNTYLLLLYNLDIKFIFVLPNCYYYILFIHIAAVLELLVGVS